METSIVLLVWLDDFDVSSIWFRIENCFIVKSHIFRKRTRMKEEINPRR